MLSVPKESIALFCQCRDEVLRRKHRTTIFQALGDYKFPSNSFGLIDLSNEPALALLCETFDDALNERL